MNEENITWSASPKPSYPLRQELFLQDLSLLVPLMDWNYFYLAWGVKPSSQEALQLRKDAEEELQKLLSLGVLRAGAVIGFFPVFRHGDSLEVFKNLETTEKPIAQLHFLRMQESLNGNHYCSLADFFHPKKVDWVGAFALSASLGLDNALEKADNDPYRILLWKTLAGRLTEAYSEYTHNEVMEKWWGYTKGKKQGIRPVPGYPTTPDHSELETLWGLLQPESIGMSITSNRMMIPEASVCGYYVAHPMARYFTIRRIGEDQLREYAKRKGWNIDTARRELNRLL